VLYDVDSGCHDAQNEHLDRVDTEAIYYINRTFIRSRIERDRTYMGIRRRGDHVPYQNMEKASRSSIHIRSFYWVSLENRHGMWLDRARSIAVVILKASLECCKNSRYDLYGGKTNLTTSKSHTQKWNSDERWRSQAILIRLFTADHGGYKMHTYVSISYSSAYLKYLNKYVLTANLSAYVKYVNTFACQNYLHKIVLLCIFMSACHKRICGAQLSYVNSSDIQMYWHILHMWKDLRSTHIYLNILNMLKNS
jgi:hypothetical protein